jgi:hypothetical protein
MRPAIRQMIQKGYPVKSVDIDQSPALAARYKVSSVPTFIVVDAAGKPLAQTVGAQPAGQLEKLFLEARAKRKPGPARAAADADDPGDDPGAAADDDRDGDRDRDRDDVAGSPPAPNPKPWETVVRIKVHGQGSIGFGSGTIIYSTPEESIILTCAHIFKLEGRQQAAPAKFPRPISIDLFDGNLRGQQVHYANETYPGKAIDYDFTRDVGLIRIKPGRKLPAARVVPKHWHPKERMLMTTVGCSEGRDATAWNTTIVRPGMQGSLSGNPTYEAIECITAPKQGRSGGGLFTSDGYVAGVCDFAEPRGDRGLYATPTSIYQLLDRNRLAFCYAPIRAPASAPETLVADNSDADRPGNRRADGPRARGQSPDRDESNLVMIPPPELLGIKAPEGDAPARQAVSGERSSHGWHSLPAPKLASRQRSETERAETTELTLDSELDSDRFGPATAPEPEPAPARPSETKAPGRWRPGRSALPELSGAR